MPAHVGFRRIPFISPGIREDFAGAALSGQWTTRLGTFQVAASVLQGATLAVDGIERMSNGNMETGNPPTGYTLSSGSTLTGQADERTGGSGAQCLQAARGTNNLVGYYANLPIIQYATYQMSVWMKVNTADWVQSQASAGIITGEQTPADWTNYTLDGQITTATAWMQFFVGNHGGDAGRFDDLSMMLKGAIATLSNWEYANAQITAALVLPASGAVPRSLICRYTDLSNYWEIRVLPGTAGNDTFIIEHNIGVMTTRATADVDWTVNSTDQIRVTMNGSTITVYAKKAGASGWTQACSYASATLNQTARAHGFMAYSTGVNILDWWEIAPF